MAERSVAPKSKRSPEEEAQKPRRRTAAPRQPRVSRAVVKVSPPQGRGLHPTAPWSARGPRRAARVARATTKIVSYGTFEIVNHDPVDTDKDNDTPRATASTSTSSTRRRRHQVEQDRLCSDDEVPQGRRTPLLFDDEVPHATDAASGDAGWAVDRLKGKKWGYYGMEDSGAGGGFSRSDRAPTRTTASTRRCTTRSRSAGRRARRRAAPR